MIAISGYARSVRSRLTRPGRGAIPGRSSGARSFDSSTENGSADGAATATGLWRARGRRTGNAADDDIRPFVYEAERGHHDPDEATRAPHRKKPAAPGKLTHCADGVPAPRRPPCWHTAGCAVA